MPRTVEKELEFVRVNVANWDSQFLGHWFDQAVEATRDKVNITVARVKSLHEFPFDNKDTCYHMSSRCNFNALTLFQA